MYYVYVLQNPKNELYKGITNDISRRLKEHKLNKNPGTRGKGPWKLVYFEEQEDRLSARAREKYFKSGFGREYLKLILNIPL